MKLGETLKLILDYREGLNRFKMNRLNDVSSSNRYESFNFFMNRNRHLNAYIHVESIANVIKIQMLMSIEN